MGKGQEFEEDFIESINQNLESKYYLEDQRFGSIADYKDFKELPTSKKEDLIDKNNSVMFEDKREGSRIFNYTSGSTGSPAIVLRSRKDLDKQREKCLKQVDLYAGERNYLVMSHTIALTGFISAMRSRDILSGFSTPYNLGFTIRAINQLSIDTLWTSPSLALKIGQMVEDNDLDHHVDTLVMIGEPVSDLARKKIKMYFGGADIYVNYGGTESGHRGYQCDNLKGTNKYHIFGDHHYYEVLEFEEDKMVKDGFGELVMTKLWNSSLPTVRYRTGDKAKLAREDCGCGKELILDLKGRAAFDSFKMSGFTIYRENFELSLDSIADLIATTYQIHIREVEIDGEVKPMLEIHLRPDESFSVSDLKTESLGDSIAENFSITNKKSYAEMVEAEIFAELEVVLRQEIVEGAKTKPIVDHRTD